MPTAHTKVALEVVDDRGNVVVAVDSGARFGGTLRRPQASFDVGVTLDIMLVFGDEPATMVVRTSTSAVAHPGATIKADVISVDVGGVHLVPPARPHRVRAGLSGRLVDVPMAELIQLMCATRRTATVELMLDDTPCGVLGFVDGRAICALTPSGSAGVEAFFTLASLEEGDFQVFYGVEPTATNVTEDTIFLLLEAARRADEARRAMADVMALDAIAEAIDGVIDGMTDSGPAASATPPPLRRRERKPADTRGEATKPGRRTASASGLFSGFFEEFSANRTAQRSDDHPRRRASDHIPRRRAEEAPMRRTDDVIAAPPFASLAFASPTDPIGVGERDTDIVVTTPVSVTSGP